MREYHFREAGIFSRSYQKIDRTGLKGEMGEVVAAFQDNMLRLESLICLTPVTVFFSMMIRLWMDEAHVFLTGTLVANPPAGSELEDNVAKKMFELKNEWIKQWVGHGNEFMNTIWNQGNMQLGELMKMMPDYTAPGVESVLSSAMTITWTVFESFATDLWIAALNASPKIAGYAAKQAIPHRRKDEPDPAINNDAGKSISIDSIDKYGYDLRDKMGIVMKDSRKFNFNRLHGIVGAYIAAFGNDAKKIFGDPKHTRLPALEGIRNVIAHCAGKIDPEFKKRATEDPAAYGTLRDLPVKSPLPIDGKMVREFIDLSASVCAELLTLVCTAIGKQDTANKGK